MSLASYISDCALKSCHQGLWDLFFVDSHFTDVSYKLKLPPHLHIAPVFHVSLLRLVVWEPLDAGAGEWRWRQRVFLYIRCIQSELGDILSQELAAEFSGSGFL